MVVREDVRSGTVKLLSDESEGFVAVGAFLEAALEVFGDDDAVVDEEAERDNESGQAHALERHAGEGHDREGDQHDGGDDGADDEAGPQTEEKDDDGKDDEEGLEDVDGNAVDGIGDLFSLVGGDSDLKADGQGGFEFVKALFDDDSVVEDAAASIHGDGKNDGGFAVEVGFALGGIDGAAIDFGDITEADRAGILGERDRELTDLSDVFEVAGWLDNEAATAGVDLTSRADDVLIGEDAGELIDGETEAGEAGVGDFDVNAFLLNSENVDSFGAGDGVELVADVVGNVDQGGGFEIGSCEGGGDDRDVTKVIVDEGRGGAFGKVGRGVADAVAEICENAIKVEIFVVNLGIDDG